jgi:hypothetical protein
MCSFEYSPFNGSTDFAGKGCGMGFGRKATASEGLDASKVGCIGD